MDDRQPQEQQPPSVEVMFVDEEGEEFTDLLILSEFD